MFEGIFDHPIWDIILLIVLIRAFIPSLFQIRIYSSHNGATKSPEGGKQVEPGKVTISAYESRSRSIGTPGEYVEFEEIKS